MVDKYLSSLDDYGGVHYNSGIPNRVFALMVDGNDDHQALGWAKALGLILEGQESALATDQFEDWAQDLLDICEAKADESSPLNKYYIPDIENGISVRSDDAIVASDCDILGDIITASGMLNDQESYCSYEGVTQGTLASDQTVLCELADYSKWTNLAAAVQQNVIVLGWDCDSQGRPKTDPCMNVGAWSGVFCAEHASDDGHGVVVILDLMNTFVAAPYEIVASGKAFPSEIGNFAGLEYLRMAYNYLQGRLPPTLGDLVHLKELDLSANRISGTLPKRLRHLRDLTSMDLHTNSFSGAVPWELCSLFSGRTTPDPASTLADVALNYLDLRGNGFTCVPECMMDFVGTYLADDTASTTPCRVIQREFGVSIELAGVGIPTFTESVRTSLRSALVHIMGSPDYHINDIGQVNVTTATSGSGVKVAMVVTLFENVGDDGEGSLQDVQNSLTSSDYVAALIVEDSAAFSGVTSPTGLVVSSDVTVSDTKYSPRDDDSGTDSRGEGDGMEATLIYALIVASCVAGLGSAGATVYGFVYKRARKRHAGVQPSRGEIDLEDGDDEWRAGDDGRRHANQAPSPSGFVTSAVVPMSESRVSGGNR